MNIPEKYADHGAQRCGPYCGDGVHGEHLWGDPLDVGMIVFTSGGLAKIVRVTPVDPPFDPAPRAVGQCTITQWWYVP